MRNVLVLYPRAVTFRYRGIGEYRELLRELGLRLIVAECEIDDVVRSYCDEVLELPPAHEVGCAWDVLRRHLEHARIDAVFAQSESALLLGSLATRHVGARGIGPAAAHACTNKLASRSALARAGVSQPHFALGDSAGDVRAFAGEHGYPLVLKGVASAAQRLVTLVRDAAAVDAAVARVRSGLAVSQDIQRLLEFARIEPVELDCDPRRQFLIESYASGDPVEVDGLAVGGDVRCFGVTEQVHTVPEQFFPDAPDGSTDTGAFGASGKSCSGTVFFIEGYQFPADRPRGECEQLEALAARALHALDVRDTAFSIELRANGDGARLIEVNGRLGIDEGFGDMFAAVIGWHPALLALGVALGEVPAWSRSPSHAALAYRCNYERGFVAHVPGASELARSATPDLHLDVHAAVGDELFDAADPRVRPHLAHALAIDAHSSRAAYERARAAVDSVPIVVGSGEPTRRHGSTQESAHELVRRYP